MHSAVLVTPRGHRPLFVVCALGTITFASPAAAQQAVTPRMHPTTQAPAAANTLDRIKSLGFRFASKSGLTMSIDDVRTPPDKKSILDRFEKEAEKAEQLKVPILDEDGFKQLLAEGPAPFRPEPEAAEEAEEPDA